MKQQDLIGRYAQLSLQADAYRAAGHPVPFDLAQAIRTVEDRARSVFTPQQMHAAQAHVAAAKSRILGEEQARAQDRDARGADKVMQDLTRGMLGHGDGLTREQFASVRKGEKKLSFKSQKPYWDPKAADPRWPPQLPPPVAGSTSPT